MCLEKCNRHHDKGRSLNQEFKEDGLRSAPNALRWTGIFVRHMVPAKITLFRQESQPMNICLVSIHRPRWRSRKSQMGAVAIFTRIISRCLSISLALCLVGGSSRALASPIAASDLMPALDSPGDTLPDAPAAQVPVTEKGLPMAILKDQAAIWTSPVRIRAHDLFWLLPLGAATGVTLATDTDAMREVSHNRSLTKTA